jgi:type IV secretory pathway VirB6-like protein
MANALLELNSALIHLVKYTHILGDMKIFAVGFYSPDDQRKDMVAIVCDYDLESAVRTVEAELEPAITDKYISFSSAVILLGEDNKLTRRCILVGPLYGDFYNRSESPSWSRVDYDSPWSSDNQ